MIMERNWRRDYWISAFLNWLPDLVIAAAATWIMNWDALYFAGAFVGLQLLYFAIWLRNTIWRWTLYWLRDRHRMQQRDLDFLVTNSLPEPDELVGSADEYLDEVAADEKLDIKIRLAAAAELGAFRYLTSSMRMQESLWVTLPYDSAIEAYRRKLGDASGRLGLVQ